jgi:hypothetical protein
MLTCGGADTDCAVTSGNNSSRQRLPQCPASHRSHSGKQSSVGDKSYPRTLPTDNRGEGLGESTAYDFRVAEYPRCKFRRDSSPATLCGEAPKRNGIQARLRLKFSGLSVILSARKLEKPNPEALIFGTRNNTPLSRRNLMRRQLTPTCDTLELKGVNWHWLRHANATLLDSVGTPISTTQALLGHSSPEITREIYLHSVPADARNAVEKVEKLIKDAKSESEQGGQIIGPNRTQLLETVELASTLIQ